MALDQSGLDDLVAHVCQRPDCQHERETVTLDPRCHRGMPTWAVYLHGSGVLNILCSICNRPVAQIMVQAGIPGGIVQ